MVQAGGKMKRLDVLITVETSESGMIDGSIQINGESNPSMLAVAVVHLEHAKTRLIKEFVSRGITKDSKDDTEWRSFGKEED